MSEHYETSGSAKEDHRYSESAAFCTIQVLKQASVGEIASEV
jgi:hypothetical protein